VIIEKITKATGAQLIWLFAAFSSAANSEQPQAPHGLSITAFALFGLGNDPHEDFLGFRPPCTTGHVFANAFLFQQQPFSKQKHLAPRLLRMDDRQMIF
jgi:hypothetical protein